MNEQELMNLKAELEMPSYEEFEALRKRIETLEFKYNELIDWLAYEKPKEDKAYMLQFLKVKE